VIINYNTMEEITGSAGENRSIELLFFPVYIYTDRNGQSKRIVTDITSTCAFNSIKRNFPERRNDGILFVSQIDGIKIKLTKLRS
jgi:hypothetical protein